MTVKNCRINGKFFFSLRQEATQLFVKIATGGIFMKENCFQIGMAILLGLVLPGIILRLFTPASQTAQSQESYATQVTESTVDGIWVLDGEDVQWMAMEEYLTGVILAEMPTTYDHDALCAQAVAARTYALKRQEDARHPKGAVCTDFACCQAYVGIPDFLDGLGFEEDVTVAKKAAQDTVGFVVTYEGALIEATYFHSSGGQTEDALAVWGVDLPYLQAVESPGEEELEDYSSSTFYTIADLERLLERNLPGMPSSWIGRITYTPGGGVETIMLAGIQYTGIQLRSLLKLHSTAFAIQPDSGGLHFTTMGKGHRVGMSQTGAQAMALQGATWQEILAHYYPGTRIDKMQEVG